MARVVCNLLGGLRKRRRWTGRRQRDALVGGDGCPMYAELQVAPEAT